MTDDYQLPQHASLPPPPMSSLPPPPQSSALPPPPSSLSPKSFTPPPQPTSPSSSTSPRPSTYMKPVPGLQGWNDPPKHVFGTAPPPTKRKSSQTAFTMPMGLNPGTTAGLIPGLATPPSTTSVAEAATEVPTDELDAVDSADVDVKAAVQDALRVVVARGVDGAQRRMVDDTERRLVALYDQLDSGNVSASLHTRLRTLAAALQSKNITTASAEAVALMTSPEFGLDGNQRWIVAVKRLVDLYVKAVS